MGTNREEWGVEGGDVIDLAEEDFMAGQAAADGADALDGNAGVVGDDHIVAFVGYVFIVAKVGPVGEKIAGGAGVDTNVRFNCIVSSFTATGLQQFVGDPSVGRWGGR
jgi:hypothetical protein